MAIFGKVISSCTQHCSGGRVLFLALVLMTSTAFGDDDPLAGAEQFNPGSPVQGSGWANIYDPVSNTTQVLPYIVIDNMAIYEGDIILGSAAAFESSGTSDPLTQQGVATQSLGRRWDDGIVYYDLNGHTKSAAILDAMSYLEDNTSIRFVARTSEANYVTFQPTGGCSSFVGRIGGSQNITIGPGCQSRGVVSHEIFHALGVYHEQSRSDRDSFVTINFGNIQAGREGNFNIANNAIDIGNYDYDSIMHYSTHAFSSNGSPTIDTIPAGTQIGNRSALSNGDIETMQFLYYTDLQLDLSTVSQANPGANVQLDIDIANRGDTEIGDIIAKDVKVSVPLPTQSTYVSFSSSDSWACSQVSQTVECEIATLDRNSDSSLQINLTAPNSLNSMVVTPTVSASNRDIQPSNDSDTATITILNLTDMGVDISTSKNSLNVGESLSVDLVLNNSSSVDAQQLNLVLNTPAEMQYDDFSGSGWNCTHAANVTTCTLASLAASDTTNLSIEFDTIGALENASISAVVSTQNTDGDLSNNNRAATVDIINLTDLAVAMTASDTVIDLGDNVTLDIDLQNNGPTTVQNISLELVASAVNLKFLEAVGNGWTCSHSGNNTSCSLATLATSASSKLSVKFDTLKKTSSASISVTVSTSITDTNTTNNSDSLSLKVEKDDSSSSSGSGALDYLFLLFLSLTIVVRKRLASLNLAR